LRNGGSLSDCGFIGFSKKRKNMVISNLIASVAWHGKHLLLKKIIDKFGKDQLDLEAIE
jgi:hypothetical protein